jgi:hypothetical protein
MSQTINTKYISPTARSGAKVKATTSSGSDSVTVPYDYNDEKQGHIDAAKKLKDKLGWNGVMYGGHTKDGYVFVFDDSPELRINPVPPLKSKSRAKPLKEKLDWIDSRYSIRKEFDGNPSGKPQWVVRFMGDYLGSFKTKPEAQKFAKKHNEDRFAPNPVKKSLVAKPKKGGYVKKVKETYFVEVSDKAKTGFKTIGIFPNEKQAREFAEQIDKEFKHTKYIRVRV